MLKKVFKLNRAYRDAKEQAVEESVNALETGVSPLVSIFAFALLVLMWVGAISTPIGPVELYETFGLWPVTTIFVVSYFSFFLGSKIVFKPTIEELKDDTSYFAVLSACRRRETRSLISIGLAVLHTLIFVLYLIDKDPKLTELL